jgi:hypothetical protein
MSDSEEDWGEKGEPATLEQVWPIVKKKIEEDTKALKEQVGTRLLSEEDEAAVLKMELTAM